MSFLLPCSIMSKIFSAVSQRFLHLRSAHRPHVPKQQTEVSLSEVFMACLVSHKDKHQEIISEF